MSIKRLFILAMTLLLEPLAYGQACAAGTVQTGSAALTTPTCTSVSTSFNVVNRNVSAGTLSGTLVASAINGMYGIRVESVPSATGTLGTAIVSISWVQNATTYTTTMATLSLAVITNALSQTVPIYPDAGTAITYSVAVSGTGSFDLHIDGRPPSV